MERWGDLAIKVFMETLTADRYTFMVPCEILEEARCDMNKVRVPSDAGIGWHCDVMQRSA